MIPLYVIMHGLIALVPHNQPNELNLMTALLVDATKKPPEMTECWARHLPTLTIKPESAKQCLDAKCNFEDPRCVCDFSTDLLSHKQMRIEIKNAPPFAPPAPMNTRVRSSLPFDNNSASDFSYVPNLTQAPLNVKLDKNLLDRSPNANQIVPAALIARMTFPFSKVYACTLGVRPDEGSNNVYSFAFRPLHAAEAPGELSQAVAQQTLASLEVPDGAKVVLTLSDYDGGNAHSMDLITTINPQSNRPEYLIQLVNSREMELDRPDELCDDGVGRDFAFFYNLAEGAPAWSARRIPHVKYTNWKSARDIVVDECTLHQHLAMTSHPICAMAGFDYPEE